MSTLSKIELKAAFEKLPRLYRLLLILKYYEKMTPPEIAEVVGLTTCDVRTQCREALGHLKRLLSPNSR